jgi:hypothetical protein
MQNSRKKGGEFVREFARVVPGPMIALYQSGDAAMQKALMRILDIWAERRVLPTSFCDEIKSAMRGSRDQPPTLPSDQDLRGLHENRTAEAASPTRSPALSPSGGGLTSSSGGSGAHQALARELDELAASQAYLQQLEQRAGAVRAALISGEALRTPGAPLPELAREYVEAFGAVAEFQRCLAADVERRERLLAQLSDLVEGLYSLTSDHRAALERAREQLRALDALMPAIRPYLDPQALQSLHAALHPSASSASASASASASISTSTPAPAPASPPVLPHSPPQPQTQTQLPAPAPAPAPAAAPGSTLLDEEIEPDRDDDSPPVPLPVQRAPALPPSSAGVQLAAAPQVQTQVPAQVSAQAQAQAPLLSPLLFKPASASPTPTPAPALAHPIQALGALNPALLALQAHHFPPVQLKPAASSGQSPAHVNPQALQSWYRNA